MVDRSFSRRLFHVFNIAFFVIYALLCLIPIIQVLAVSLSASHAVAAGKVMLIPVDFTLKSYEYVLKKQAFWQAMGVSAIRIVLGVAVGMTMTILAAYPLSKAAARFRARTVFVWMFIFAMLFSGGMIPTYMVVRYTGLLNNIWALVLPSAIQVYNIILLMNFFRNVPAEMEESAFIDGAGHFRTLVSIYIPLSMPSIATLMVFTVVTHWNSWFDGMIYMNDAAKYPMQTYLQAILVQPNVKLITKATADLLRSISDRTLKASQVFIAAIPVLMIYPFLQRYFVSGIMLGGVKE